LLKVVHEFILNSVYFYVPEIQGVTKPLAIKHVNKEYSYKIYKRNINNISIKYGIQRQ
jgi:hypothetical protein